MRGASPVVVSAAPLPPLPPPMPLKYRFHCPQPLYVPHARQCEEARACSAGAIADECRHSSFFSRCRRRSPRPLQPSATTHFRILVVLLVDPPTGAGRWIADVRANRGIRRTLTPRVLYCLHRCICHCNVPPAPTFTSSFHISIGTLLLLSSSSKALETSFLSFWLSVPTSFLLPPCRSRDHFMKSCVLPVTRYP